KKCPADIFSERASWRDGVEQHSLTEDYENLWKFTGHELDKETGMYYAGARYYNPKWSIWLSVDPLAEQAPNWTPYRYGFNNPIRFMDPDGRKEFENYDAYKAYQKENGFDILSANKIGSQGHWLTSDREGGTAVWDEANMFNIQNNNTGQYKPYEQV